MHVSCSEPTESNIEFEKIKARAKQIQERLTKDLDQIYPGFSRIQNHLKKTTSKEPSSLI